MVAWIDKQPRHEDATPPAIERAAVLADEYLTLTGLDYKDALKLACLRVAELEKA